MRHSIPWAAALFIVLSGPAFAMQVVLTPSKDNTLYEDAAGSLSNALGQNVFSGRVANGSTRRAVMAFDIASNVPAGATITSVTLRLTTTRVRFIASQTMTLHTLSKDWGEGGSNAGNANDGQGAPPSIGDATWIHTAFPTSNWTTAGGDFNAASSGSAVVGGPGLPFTWGSTAAMVADVQGWLDDPATNFGWLLKGNESTFQTAKRFGSKENATASRRPTLTVDFDTTTPAHATTWGAIKDLYR